MGHFHWRVTVTFDSGLVHESEWHAERHEAERLVCEEARIMHEREHGNRGSIKQIDCKALD